MDARKIHINQDDSAFTRIHALEDMAVEGLERVVDFYAAGEHLAGLAFCVNMQRALYDSRVWETIMDTNHLESRGGTTTLSQVREVAGTAALLEKGIDSFGVWLRRARHHGIEAFLSMRMNDCHGLESHGSFDIAKPGEDQSHFFSHATEF